jgi:hypothetical protein
MFHCTYNRVHIVYIVMNVMGTKKDWGTYLFIKFLMIKMDPLNVVSHNIAVYKNVTTALDEGLV